MIHNKRSNDLQKHRCCAGWLALTAFSAICWLPQLNAKPIVEQIDKLDLDWSALKVRSTGVAKPLSEGESTAEVEKRAIEAGLLSLQNSVAGYHNKFMTAASGQTASASVGRSSYCYNTEYYSDGSVKIYLENSLAKALLDPAIKFKAVTAPAIAGTQYSGVVLKLKSAMKPRAIYDLVGEGGEVLFSAGDVAQDAFAKNMMGAWFANPSPSEISSLVGSQPLVIPVDTAENSNSIVVPVAAQSLLEANRALLENARVVVSVPL